MQLSQRDFAAQSMTVLCTGGDCTAGARGRGNQLVQTYLAGR